MTPYTPVDNFSTIQLYDTSDPVLGGDTGESNIPVKGLADRSLFLWNRTGKFISERTITANGSITAGDIYKKIKIVTNANLVISLDAVNTFRIGTKIKVKVKITALTGKAVAFIPNGTDIIEDGKIQYDASTLKLYACDGEEFNLVAGDANGDGTADYWDLLDAKGNFDIAGMDILSRRQPRNTIVANGCQPESSGSLLVRADYPRLVQYASTIWITDTQWLSDPIRYRGFFSSGNGTTTFRIADMRSMVHRGLDIGRGLSVARMDGLNGGYEKDDFLSHDHRPANDALAKNYGFLGISFAGDAKTTPGFDASGSGTEINIFDAPKAPLILGGAETRMKNIGFTPYTYY